MKAAAKAKGQGPGSGGQSGQSGQSQGSKAGGKGEPKPLHAFLFAVAWARPKPAPFRPRTDTARREWRFRRRTARSGNASRTCSPSRPQSGAERSRAEQRDAERVERGSRA